MRFSSARGELGHEILAETLGVVLDGLVQAPGGEAVNRGEVVIEDHAVTSQNKDRLGDVLGEGGRQGARASPS